MIIKTDEALELNPNRASGLTASRDGAIPPLSREQAEALFLMDRAGLLGADGRLAAAVRAVRDHLLRGGASVVETDVDWLLGMVGDRPTAFGRAVVFAVVRGCEQAPPRLMELAMRAAVGRSLLV